MNLAHRVLCSSNRWRQIVESQVLPWTLDGLDLGTDVLEIGPGYGAVTDQLMRRVPQLTCVEINCAMADDLRRRTAGRNVTVLCEDATRMSLPHGRFDAVLCFTMLHHIPSTGLQDQLLREVFRVLRPGGTFAGTDSRESRLFRFLHLFDTLTVVDPSTFAHRLATAGFEQSQVDVNPHAFRFRARKPVSAIPILQT
jgi:SAM-dependent methyltransferase